MNKIKQTIVVGLGALGRVAVEHFKERVVSKYGKPLPAISVFVFDVKQPNTAGQENTDLDQSRYQSNILTPDEHLVVELDSEFNDAKRAQEYFPWLSQDIKETDHDWTTTRAYARAAFNQTLSELQDFFADKMRLLGSFETAEEMQEMGFELVTDSNYVNLIVIGDIADTASSALIGDVTYVLDTLFNQQGLQTLRTGILIFPATGHTDPLSNANAYATLKEINAYMSGTPYIFEYPSINLPIESHVPIFDNGCYLLDTRNERALALKDINDVPHVAGEWIFRTLLTSSIKERIDNFVGEQALAITVQGQSPAYSSFGLTTYHLPTNQLLKWCADNLSTQIIGKHLIAPRSFSDVAGGLRDFQVNTNFAPDAMIGQLSRDDKDTVLTLDGGVVEHIDSAPYREIIDRVIAARQRINGQIIPSLKKRVDGKRAIITQTVSHRIDTELEKILSSNEQGSLSKATQLVGRIRDDASETEAVLNRRQKAYQAREQQLKFKLDAQGPVLRRALESIPSVSTTLFAIVTGGIAPILMFSAWLWQGYRTWTDIWRLVVIGMIWLATILAGIYAWWKTREGVEAVRKEYLENLRDHFKSRLNYELASEAQQIYPAIQQAAQLKLDILQHLAGDLHVLFNEFKRKTTEDSQAELCSDTGFAMQKSVLTPELIDNLINQREHAKPEVCIVDLPQEKGKLGSWINLDLAELRNNIYNFAVKKFTQTPSIKDEMVSSLLQRRQKLQDSSLNNKDKKDSLNTVVKEMYDRSAALCSYNQVMLGQSATIAKQAFVGMDSDQTTQDNVTLRQAFQTLNPQVNFEPIGDKETLVVTSLTRGMPLFGLIRINEMRRHYINVLKGDNAPPLHLEDDLAFTHDLQGLGFDAKNNNRSDAATIFALGCALDIIQRDGETKRFSAKDERGRPLGINIFGSRPLESATLLGTDDRLLLKLDDLIQKKIQEIPNNDLILLLENYCNQDNLSDWERKKVFSYIKLLQDS